MSSSDNLPGTTITLPTAEADRVCRLHGVSRPRQAAKNRCASYATHILISEIRVFSALL
jgi:hypothetical protein